MMRALYTGLCLFALAACAPGPLGPAPKGIGFTGIGSEPRSRTGLPSGYVAMHPGKYHRSH